MPVRVEKANSSKLDPNISVPQDSVLVPLLFIIKNIGFETEFFTILYADDTTLIDHDKSLYQK